MGRVLFVCTGNTCRSPMAEALLKSKNLQGIEARSAGVFAAQEVPASPNSIRVMDENGIKHNHQSRLISKKDIDWATLILTMTFSHKQAIIAQFPEAAGKTFTLKEYTGENGSLDVSDPFGGSVDVYRTTFSELDSLIDKAVLKLTGQ